MTDCETRGRPDEMETNQEGGDVNSIAGVRQISMSERALLSLPETSIRNTHTDLILTLVHHVTILRKPLRVSISFFLYNPENRRSLVLLSVYGIRYTLFVLPRCITWDVRFSRE